MTKKPDSKPETEEDKSKREKAREILQSINSTADVKVPDGLVDQVIGQQKAVEVIRNAARQKRNVLLVGVPGIGKSMLAQAMSELLPSEDLEDIAVTTNVEDENVPKVKLFKAGEGKKVVNQEKMKNRISGGNLNIVFLVILLIGSFLLLQFGRQFYSDVIVAAMLIGLFAIAAMMSFALALGRGRGFPQIQELGGEGMKLIIDNSDKKKAPFVDATGTRAGSLLGDVRHDPFQSFTPESKLYVLEGNDRLRQVSFEALWKKLSLKYKRDVEVKKLENGKVYEAITLPESEKLFTLGYRNGVHIISRIRIINRREFTGNVVEVTATGKKISTTLEHKFVLEHAEKVATDLSTFDELIAKDVKLQKRRRF